jgi:hypothetical protein
MRDLTWIEKIGYKLLIILGIITILSIGMLILPILVIALICYVIVVPLKVTQRGRIKW